MKRKFCVLILSGFCVAMNLMAGCTREMKTESDGIFEYFYMVNQGYDKSPAQDYYVIVSSFAELDKITYIPAYYNNKQVRAVYCEFFHGWYYPTKYGLDFFGAETIYFPFCCELEYKSRNFPLISFFANNSLPYSEIYDWGANLPNGGIIYLTSGLYNKYNEFTMNNLKDSAYNSIDDAHSIYEYSSEKICHLIRANTAYLFNYEGAPNEGYFFINDFEYGDKIEDTPYERYEKDIHSMAGIRKRNVITNGILTKTACRKKHMTKTVNRTL